MPESRVRAVLVLGLAAAPGCGGSSLACGPGTAQEGNVCLPRGGDGSAPGAPDGGPRRRELHFGQPDRYRIGDGMKSGDAVLVADFNGDGKLDIAAVARVGMKVVVLAGRGDGTFAAGSETVVGAAHQLVAGDVNGDRLADLILKFAAEPAIWVLLSRGDTFAPPAKLTVGAVPEVVALGDLNGDGRPDLVAAGRDRVAVLDGRGDGTFAMARAVVTFQSPPALGSPLVVDTDGDGKLDVLVGKTLLLGNGDGTLRNAPAPDCCSNLPDNYAISVRAGQWVAGDFNDDGKLDLAVAANDFVAVLRGTGGGRFDPAVGYHVGGFRADLATADFDGDGRADLATPNTGSPVSTVLLGQAGGAFDKIFHFFHSSVITHGDGARTIAAGDLDSDGLPDLVVGDLDEFVNVLLNTTAR